MTTLTIHFPKQKRDYKQASRLIRQNKIFSAFITGKSEDRRYLHFDFQDEQKYKILRPILFKTLEELDYDVEEFTE